MKVYRHKITGELWRVVEDCANGDLLVAPVSKPGGPEYRSIRVEAKKFLDAYEPADAPKKDASKFGPSCVVRLKSGGPAMTVENDGPADQVWCKWFDNSGLLHSAMFSSRTLVEALPDTWGPLSADEPESRG